MKETQIEEMTKIVKAKLGCVCRYDCGNCGGCYSHDYAETLYNAGYRKQSEVIDEFADRLTAKLLACGIYPVFVKNAIASVVAEMKSGE